MDRCQKKILLILVLFSFFPIYLSAGWTRTYGRSYEDWGRAVQQTFDNGYIIIGRTSAHGAGYYDIYMIRTNTYGDTLWTKTYGGINDDVGYSVQQTYDSGYIITGWTESYGAGCSDVYLIKTDKNGDILWTRTYGGTDYDKGSSIQITADSGYIISGWTKSYGNSNENAYLIKTDKNGDTLWTRVYGGSDNDWFMSIESAGNNDYIAVGATESFGSGDFDVFLIRLNNRGDTLWARTYGGRGRDWGMSVNRTQDDGFIITGGTNTYGSGDYNIYLIKVNSYGDTLWTRTYGEGDICVGYSVQQTNDDGYIITGWSSWDVCLIKTDKYGEMIWSKIYGGSGEDFGSSVRQTRDGGYIFVGKTYSFGVGSHDVYLVKTDSFGNIK